MMYEAYQVHADLLSPSQMAARTAASYLGHGWLGLSQLPSARKLAASWEVYSLIRLTHHRPDFGITSVQVDGQELPVREEVVQRTPFATLLRFVREGAPPDQPRVLVAAPLSGHFATLLRDTVRTLLADHDVYITDWHNGRHVPLADGPFGLDDYIEHLMIFLRRMGPGCHVLAVCQPCVPVLAAVALMAEDDDPAQPLSMTLMAGPVDTRVNPTGVNELANSKPIEWFDQNLVHGVPARFAGAGRRVYPGFLQLTAFMSMNPERHRKAFADLHAHIVAGETEKADATRAFYDEYFAVNDLPAEFYLETVKLVFQDYALAKGELRWRGRPVRPQAIRRTALFTVEGERDDICAIGQTVAAHDLCSGLAPWRKTHHVQLGVGHYGVFSGRRWQQQIYPRVRELVHSMQD
jgi:poly(3-hydroxybutyrate) depolymerase